ncbi:MAG: SAM-dependent methyltransferase [Desulfobaccales bacterium]
MSLGPGFPDYIIPRARAALDQAQVVAGYRTYVELIKPLLTRQEVVATGMKAEVQRCQAAIDRALAGDRVALVSSGDAGIYGMAGLVLEICAARGLQVSPPDEAGEVDFHLEVIPGGAGPGRGRGPPRGAADARFRLHFAERPADPLGDHSETPGTGGPGGFRHRAL